MARLEMPMVTQSKGSHETVLSRWKTPVSWEYMAKPKTLMETPMTKAELQINMRREMSLTAGMNRMEPNNLMAPMIIALTYSLM